MLVISLGVTQALLQGTDVLARLSLNVGREPGTAMPSEWAASGARLGLPLNVRFSSKAASKAAAELLAEDDIRQCEHVGGAPTLIGEAGEQIIRVRAGAWCTGPDRRGDRDSLNFWLNFPDGATRRDVSIPPGPVYFICPGVWSHEALAKLRDDLDRTQAEYDALGEQMRALDKDKAPLARLVNFRQQVLLSEKRTSLGVILRSLEKSLPSSDGVVDLGNGVSVERKGGLCIRREKQFGVEYHILGTFTISALDSIPEEGSLI